MASSFDETKLWGCFLVSIGSIFFAGYFFLALFSKLLPPSQIPLIPSFQNDWYYCFLVPLTLPIFVVVVYFHWLSMKTFKHA
ncbi:putative phosphatidylinositol N-acetylglucosaminyltransferase subunit Y [Medicago truncatula]|uniref:Putative phosphatidylinositol N-acetylglucosaminyltransferase subunit Y n=1 Tax=Medicago truncatula TaxID=3880 RepID=G7L3Y1_MEDTR|nr:transmembrane protein, putative [Medicago truncatula]RHN48533.1 putative phosphatidylinositol N-acetylglucosaminyltransferase subunit Y [Medicago truncatula]